MSGPAAQADAAASAEAARREGLLALSRFIGQLLAFAVGPSSVGIYLVHVWLHPCWQFRALLALTTLMWGGLWVARGLLGRDRVEAGAWTAFLSMWTFALGALLLRTDAFAVCQLAFAVMVVMIWLLTPRWTTVATVIVVLTTVATRVVMWAGVLPAVTPPAGLSLVFDLSYTLAILPFLALGLRLGHRLQEIPLRHLDSAVATQRRLVSAVARAVPEISAVADGASRGATQLAASASEQAVTVERVAAAAHQLEALSRQAASSADEARTVGDASLRGSSETAEALAAVERELAAFQGDLEAMRLGVEELSRRSAGTEQVIESVEGVHQAVNVLSINARLEAARAGEAGKGFAVVASEMGGLITGTEASVREGRRLLGAVRADATAVRERGQAAAGRLAAHLEAMRGARDRVSEVLEGYGVAARSLESIAQAGREQQRQIEVVAQAMRELAGTAADLRRVAADLASAVSQVARGQAELAALLAADERLRTRG